jgi:ribosomal protein S18 acetylase RimI-like enzyme
VSAQAHAPYPASGTDAGRLAAALADAFTADPVFGWLLPDARSRHRRLVRFFDLELRHVVMPAGRVWTCDQSAGASLELPPGAWRMPIRSQLTHARSFARIFGRRLPHAAALITSMERRHLREPHFYIPYVGVATTFQGRGIGGRLLRQTLDRCDAERLPAYLEATSERNAALYARLGFEHLGCFTLRDSPPLWPMRRPPAAGG